MHARRGQYRGVAEQPGLHHLPLRVYQDGPAARVADRGVQEEDHGRVPGTGRPRGLRAGPAGESGTGWQQRRRQPVAGAQRPPRRGSPRNGRWRPPQGRRLADEIDSEAAEHGMRVAGPRPLGGSRRRGEVMPCGPEARSVDWTLMRQTGSHLAAGTGWGARLWSGSRRGRGDGGHSRAASAVFSWASWAAMSAALAGVGACWSRPRSGISLMNRASSGTATANRMAQPNTWEMAEASDSSRPVRTGAGSRRSAAGSTRPPPLVSLAPAAPSRVVSSVVSWWLNTAPNRDTPNEPPIERKNVAALLD